MTALVLKHMARELDVEPMKLRRILRGKFGVKRSWRWTERNRDYESKLNYARKQINGKA